MDANKKVELADAVREAARCGKITCPQAREIAERLELPYTAVGKACNELEIKVKGCSLGCF